MKWHYFDSRAKRREIYLIGHNLAEHIFDNKIPNVVFIDTAARRGYLVLREAWRKRYQGVPLPNVYFTNPEGYGNRNAAEVTAEIDSTYKRLALDKSQRILFFDVCMHRGLTMGRVLRGFRAAGYNNLESGIAQAKDDYSILETPDPDFIALNEDGFRCSLFFWDRFIVKDKKRITSSRSEDEGTLFARLNFLQDIQRIFKKRRRFFNFLKK